MAVFSLRIYVIVAVLMGSGLVVSAQPNVLFIAVDDLNNMVGFLGGYPGVKTPHMDRLASMGVSFSNAHCAAPGCNPSRVSVMTGRYPSSTGIYENQVDWRRFPDVFDLQTLPEIFRKNGYKVIGGGKLYHAHSLNIRAYTGFFDSEPWDEYFPSKEAQMTREVKPGTWPMNGIKRFYRGHFDWAPLEIEDDDMADGKLIRWAEEQLSREHEKPLFIGVGIYRPHVPWWSPKKYFDQHPLEEIVLPPVPEDDFEDIPPTGNEWARKHWQAWVVENNQWKKAVQGYLASMTFADAMVGRLMKALENGPLAENTLIVLWSDHGYHLGHKQHWEKFVLWNQATQVPLIFVDPRHGTAGAVTNQPASLVDIYPTLVDLCDLKDAPRLDGQSLLPLIRNPALKTGRAVLTTHKFRNHSVRTVDWHYIRYADGSEELYNPQNDPDEFRNLAELPEFSAVKQNLSGMLPDTNADPKPRTGL
ncbi:MAG: sulfatase-like hydrolase/transferase [Opitutae bacterium]|nr:sulfatase-like hydrolase/transferase [Opitutae bacterium]